MGALKICTVHYSHLGTFLSTALPGVQVSLFQDVQLGLKLGYFYFQLSYTLGDLHLVTAAIS